MIFPAPTPRLVLRAWREEDLGTFTAMNADPRVMEYFPAPLAPEQSAEFMERIREEFSTEGFGLYAVERGAARLYGAAPRNVYGHEG